MSNNSYKKNIWLIHHPERCTSSIKGATVYHDSFFRNQDPYIWNNQFIHSFCHMAQLGYRPKEDDIIFWVSSNDINNMECLYCDLVFVVDSSHKWFKRNPENIADFKDEGGIPFFENENSELYKYHFRWVIDHVYKETKSNGYQNIKRVTLKAKANASFQPQKEHKLIDILPRLRELDIDLTGFSKKAGTATKPFKINDRDVKKMMKLYNELNDSNKLTGRYICKNFKDLQDPKKNDEQYNELKKDLSEKKLEQEAKIKE